MELGGFFQHLRTRGVEILEWLHANAATADDAAEAMGSTRKAAAAVVRCAAAICGPCPRGQKKYRSQAVAKAKEFGLCVAGLTEINEQLRKLASDVDYPVERLRAEIVAECEGLSVDEIKQLAQARVAKLNKKSGTVPLSDVQISKQEDAHGKRFLVGNLDAAAARGFFDWLEDETRKLYRRDSGLTWGQTRAKVLENFDPQPLADASGIGVHVILRGDELADPAASPRDEFALTNGTVMSKNQLLEQRLAGTGWAVVYDDLTRLPERAWRIQRLANAKQHAMLDGHQAVCAVPGCEIRAVDCQAHHIVAFAEGGNTNVEVLVKLCAFHHAEVTAGRASIEIGPDGVAVWCSRGSPERARGNSHPAAKLAGARLLWGAKEK